jgi:ribosome-binding factor A
VKDRVTQVNRVVQRELGQIIRSEGDFPENALVTLTRVQSSPNLQQAKVYISVMPEEHRKEVMKSLNADIYSLQQSLNKKLAMRPVPKIVFVTELETAHAQRIEEILDNLKE